MREHAAALGIAADRVPFGVAVDGWPCRAPRPRDPSVPARLVHVGSLNRVKDQGTLLRAFRVLLDQGADCHLDVVGEDTLDGELQRLAASLELAGRITFHGFVPHDALRTIVAGADLFLLTSRHESGPLVVLEAAIVGVPTVGTAVGHLADWAPDAAVAVPVGDSRALAHEVATLLADEERRLRIATLAQARASAEDADWSAARILDRYEALAR
jgi:glycosyltransferase involved in cell wall biosynthesis